MSAECDKELIQAQLQHRYLNNLLGIPWVYGSAATAEVLNPSMTLQNKQFEDAVAQMAAGFIWLGMSFIKSS